MKMDVKPVGVMKRSNSSIIVNRQLPVQSDSMMRYWKMQTGVYAVPIIVNGPGSVSESPRSLL
jgi:hypothetical protein